MLEKVFILTKTIIILYNFNAIFEFFPNQQNLKMIRKKGGDSHDDITFNCMVLAKLLPSNVNSAMTTEVIVETIQN